MPQFQDDPSLYPRIGSRLKAFKQDLMKATGMSSKEFAHRAGMTIEELKIMEAGKITEEHIQDLYDISQSHGLNLQYLIDGEETIQARQKELAGLVRIIAENRCGKFDAYMLLLDHMQNPGIEHVIFTALDTIVTRTRRIEEGEKIRILSHYHAPKE